MSSLDVQHFSSPRSWTPSPDGRWMLYTITTPDWQEDERQSDIHLVSMEDGVASSRQLTFTGEKNETSPKWSRDGSFFVFASDRDDETGEDVNQLYLMRPDGGEARRITDAEEGVADFDLSDDARSLVYRRGESGQEQLYRLPVDSILTAEPEQLTEGEAGVESWQWAPDGRSIYFIRPDSWDEDDELRREQGFTVDIKNMATPLSNLWVVDLAPLATRRLTDAANVSVTDFDLSLDRALDQRSRARQRSDTNVISQPPACMPTSFFSRLRRDTWSASPTTTRCGRAFPASLPADAGSRFRRPTT